ncbi:conserved hypothetical protein [Culex quinquefasciatus]|uniref:Uncharacterized protein n=1 Tax=Culex quinquefasciatus TaxID=7176 RepID=B0X6R0_CULQU|nr:conserved hypothetical protein [Culex quinquefasciatus]|eukprot:XP_001865332.1 conserved hypothetical protein [Culex quinquefasciatus]
MFAGSDYFRQLAAANDDSADICVKEESVESTSNGGKADKHKSRKPRKAWQGETYTTVQLQLAYEAVQNGMSMYHAGKMYGVPRPTLQYRVKNNVSKPDVKTGPKCYLSQTQELSMVASLHALADAGFTVNYKLIQIFGTEYVKANEEQFPEGIPFRNTKPSFQWIMCFLKRHPDLAERTTTRSAFVASKRLPEWFGCVSEYLTKMGLQTVVQNRRQVFTMDDVELKRGKNRKNEITFTCLFGANANGNLLPPLILYPHTFTLPTQNKQSELKYAVAHQDTKLTVGNALYQWLTRVFQPWLIEENVPRPVILFLDGHRHQMGYLSSQFCHQHQIVPVSLLPRVIHLLRPLNEILFVSIEKLWHEEMQNSSTGSFTTMDPLLTPVLDRLTDTAESIIRDGFLRSKIYPWDPEGCNTVDVTQPQPDENRSKLVLFRRMLESRLTAHELGEFKARRHDEEWRGPVEYASLFQVWRELMDEIDSVETGACSDMDTTQEGDGCSVEPDLVAVKEEETGECLLDFVKEEPSVDCGE